MDLHIFWFVALGILLTGYAVLDGFDLGAGILHLSVGGENERRTVLNAIGPLWDGNEVWLITFGGALFAAFPHAYATVFSGFYIPFMILLFALIFRAVSIEFRSKRESRAWRRTWDAAFFGGSALASFLFGVVVGNMLIGLPVGPDKEFTADLFQLLGVFPLLSGALVVALFALHGSAYLAMKTEGPLHERIRALQTRWYVVFAILLLAVTVFAWIAVPNAIRNFAVSPWGWVAVAFLAAAVVFYPFAVRRGKSAHAFLASACTVLALTFLFCFSMYPNLVPSTISPDYHITIRNAASSERTLSIMRWFALIGMPLVIVYSIVIHRVFRGKVKIDGGGY
ncbi:MAG: cytochrome d ubiquinol oxidase subunit II [Bacteroidota bacterium]|nr:cytochrome d ubiquinol oxidase subunit II [Bacteroidota bacterium]